MEIKRIARNGFAIAAATALLTGTALAQNTGGYSEAEDDSMEVSPFGMTVDEIEDMNLSMSDGTTIGEIENVLVDMAGTPVAFSVDPSDDMQMEDDTDVVITIDQVSLEDGRLTTSLNADSIQRLPRRDD